MRRRREPQFDLAPTSEERAVAAETVVRSVRALLDGRLASADQLTAIDEVVESYELATE